MNMEGDGQNGQPAEGVTSIDQIASMMGDEDEQGALDESGEEGEPQEESEEVEGDESGEDGQDEAEEPAFTIKHDGKEVSLKQSELIELAQKGFDYTQKTMALGNEREASKVEREQIAQQRKHYEDRLSEQEQHLQALAQIIEGTIGSAPDISLAQENAAEYLARKELHERQKGKYHQALYSINQVQEQKARERQAFLDQKGVEAEKVLADTLPGWKDDPRKAAEELNGYLNRLGISAQNAPDAYVEPGLWQLAYKAKEYDRLQAERAAIKPVNKVPKVEPTRTANQPQQNRKQEAMKAFKAKPSVNTLANLLD